MGRAATTTEDRAISLLGSGVTPEQTASALGVSVSRISQLLSDPEFTAKVAELRFETLNKHNLRDSQYDSMEDRLISKLDDLLPMMMRPMEVLKAIQVINAAKRRGQAAPEQVTNQQTVVSIVMPATVINRFTTNSNNQVTRAGEQELLTIQSGTLLKESQLNQAKQLSNLLEGEQHGSNQLTGIGQDNSSTISRPKELAPARTQQEESRAYSPSGFVPVRSFA